MKDLKRNEYGVTWQDDDACPRCGCKEFKDFNMESEDLTYTSNQCRRCGLWHDGWVDVWLLADGPYFEDSADKYDPANPEHQEWNPPTEF